MSDGNDNTREFECIEPELGSQYWRLEEPDTDADLRRRLEDHLAYCDACRLKQAANRHLARALQTGDLTLTDAATDAPQRSALRLVTQSPATWGGLAFAAGLTLMMILPPEPPRSSVTPRSGETPIRFLRPVQEQVVGAVPHLAWTEIDGASGYRLILEDLEGTFRWQRVVEATSLSLPDSVAVPSPARLRAHLESVPPDLTPAGGVSVTFRTGSGLDIVKHRLHAAPLYTRLLAGLGLLTAAGTAIAALLRRR